MTSHGPDLDHLAATWADHPEGLAFAALADGLRKAGALDDALEVVREGLVRRPDAVPGLIVLSRVEMDRGEYAAAMGALQAALRVDPAHPVVLEAMAEVSAASGDIAASRAWREALDASLPDEAEAEADAEGSGDVEAGAAEDDGGSLLSESLAALYERQGHLDRAHEVYAALADREPANAALAARRDDLAAALETRRPLPYDARLSQGTSVRDWLAAVAHVEASAAPPTAGYDAFYQAASPPPGPTTDFDAFQSWLQGLPR